MKKVISLVTAMINMEAKDLIVGIGVGVAYEIGKFFVGLDQANSDLTKCG